MRWLAYAAALLALLLIAIVVIGWMLPRDHVAAMRARIPAPPAAVWATITDVAAYPSWRTDVERVELVGADASGRRGWRELSGRDTVEYRVQTEQPPARFVARIATPDLPYGGAWEYRVAPAGDSASDVTITERGIVYNPIFRVVSRYVFGHTRTIDTYLRALGRRHGVDVTPDSVSVFAEAAHGL